MSHLSFLDLPIVWEPGLPRWAKCDYLTTVSLSRCNDPYRKDQNQPRKYLKIKAAQCDIEAVDRCLSWVLGITGPG